MTAPDLRKIPSVDAVIRDPAAASLIETHGREAVLRSVRSVLEELRAAMAAAGPAGTPLPQAADPSPAAVLGRVVEDMDRRFAPGLGPAVNATGVLMHSGLGRALLSEAARRALAETTAGYCTLALDLDQGRRSQRDRHVEALLRELTGAEAATVANNNAAATMLVLNTLARGREVVVSRGQLIEIGGSFRLPDVMRASGAVLREVGTTNKTHIRDYEEAVGESTGALLRVHHSNYRIVGFTAEPSLEELAALARRRGLPVIDDLGSGALVDLREYGLPTEPLVPASLRAGADVACFSGDKLIGGPQCGIIVGRSEWLARIRRNPLARAVRCGKLTLAALEATLKLFLAPDRLRDRHPLYRMLGASIETLGRRADAVAARLAAGVPPGTAAFAVEPGESQIGSGAVPADTLPTRLLAVRPERVPAEALARSLRFLRPPVFTRIADGAVRLDFRTIQPGEDALVAESLLRVLGVAS